MEKLKKLFLTSLLLIATALTSACATRDAYTGEEKTSNATLGSVIGAIGGVAVGAAT